jgi:N4-gp56 family major capsid protein
MTTDNLNSSLVTITVAEKGKALQCSELLLNTSFDDVMASMTRKLGEHYARSLDAQIRNSLRGTPNLIRVNNRATRTAFVAGDTFNMEVIRVAVERLATNKAPKFDGDHYVCLLHPHQASALRRDPDWIKVTQYGDPTRAYRGEIGRIEDVRFIETTNVTVVKNGAYATPGQVHSDGRADADLANEIDFHATIDTYQAYILGANAVGIAYALPVEIRDNGVEDFGRKHSLAWYGIYGSGRIEDGHSLLIESV